MIYGFVLCIGDSLLTGARNEAGLSVPRFIGDELSMGQQKWIGIDEGVNGETTGELLRRLYKVARSYPEAKDVVVCVGTNDAKRPRVSSGVFKRNYAELLRTLEILKKRCYVCLLPVRSGFGAPDDVDNKAIEQYNRIIREMAEENPDFVSVVDLTNVPTKCRDDGIHFNLQGDRWAAKRISGVIVTRLS